MSSGHMPDTGGIREGAPCGHTSTRSSSVLPNPLHPAVVHFPIVLAFMLPLFAIGALVAIRRGARPLRAWSLPLAVGAALTLSSWVARSKERRVGKECR